MDKTIDKRMRIQEAAAILFREQGVETTSVNDIVKKANVAKGTFYVYYKDKQELISQILTKQHGMLINDILNHSYELSIQNNICWKHAFIDELIAFYIQNPKVLHSIQKNIASILDTKEHRNKVASYVERMPQFLELMQQEDESRQKTCNRFLMAMEVIGFVCFNAIAYEQPGPIDEMVPELKYAMYKLLERKE